MAMRAMTRDLVACDAKLQDKRRRLLAENDPDEAATLREDIDDLLDQRFALSEGRARGGRRTD
jgi:hypothetical protein